MSGPEKVVRTSGEAELVDELRARFPEVLTDGRVDVDRLRALLGDAAAEEGPDEHYGLRWPGKERARRLAVQPPQATLRPVPGAGVDEDKTKNALIVGDNLQVLLALQKSYANSVKLIYIDPPYNTGKDFIYKDSFATDESLYLQETRQADLQGRLVSNPETGGRFHSNWLNMIYPRLKLARSLLRPDGIIVIHIDEHEVETLVLVCKEIFGEENYLGTIAWDKGNPKGDSKGLSYQHESIVIFAKDSEQLPPPLRPKPNAKRMLDEARSAVARAKHINDARKAFASWATATEGLSGGERAYSKLDDSGRVYRLVSMAWPNKKLAPQEYFIPLKHPVTGQDCPVPERGWRNPPDTMRALLAEGKIAFGPDASTQPQRIYYLDENIMEGIPSVLRYAGSDDALLKGINIPFDHPKPVEFSSNLLSWFTEPGDLIMDFFAGSGTTGHATWHVNRRGEGTRSFILVQVDAPVSPGSTPTGARFSTIDEVTKERLLRVSKQLRAEGTTGDLGFRVYREDASLLARRYAPPAGAARVVQQELFTAAKAAGQLRPPDLFPEVLLLLGFPLETQPEALPPSGANTLYRFEHPRVGLPLVLCLDPQIDEAIVPALSLMPPHTFACRDEALSDVVKLRIDDALRRAGSTFKVL